VTWFSQNAIEHNFASPPATRFADAELEGLYAVLVALGLTKRMPERLMRDFPQNGRARELTVKFVTDGEGDIRVTVAHLDEEPSSTPFSIAPPIVTLDELFLEALGAPGGGPVLLH
jgi:hypothetical protein